MSEAGASFSVGYVVEHRLFGYRGVVFEVDACFEGSDAWYEQVARSRPPRDRPWYHVLPDGMEHTTYVAERNLEAADPPAAIQHPLLDQLFDEFRDGRYIIHRNLS